MQGHRYFTGSIVEVKSKKYPLLFLLLGIVHFTDASSFRHYFSRGLNFFRKQTRTSQAIQIDQSNNNESHNSWYHQNTDSKRWSWNRFSSRSKLILTTGSIMGAAALYKGMQSCQKDSSESMFDRSYLNKTNAWIFNYFDRKQFLQVLNDDAVFEQLVVSIESSETAQKYIELSKKNIATVLRTKHGKKFIQYLIDVSPNCVNEFVHPILMALL